MLINSIGLVEQKHASSTEISLKTLIPWPKNITYLDGVYNSLSDDFAIERNVRPRSASSTFCQLNDRSQPLQFSEEAEVFAVETVR
jgi:hypothetical protein